MGPSAIIEGCTEFSAALDVHHEGHSPNVYRYISYSKSGCRRLAWGIFPASNLSRADLVRGPGV